MKPSTELDSQQIKKRIETLTRDLDSLRFTFEQYFLGLERIPPLAKRQAVQRSFRDLANAYIKNTALKFKLKQLVARHSSLSNYWNRILRQIDEGTYKRDQFKLKLNIGHEKDPKQKSQATADAGLQQKLQQLPQDGITEVVKKFVAAKQKGKENLPDPAKLHEKLTKEVLKLKKKYACKTVQFKVVNKDGKTSVKAIAKK